jgi:ubiquinone/menaquinone biosynthesis C-methylase UbiE
MHENEAVHMKRELASQYRCPNTGETLTLQDAVLQGEEVISGKLVSVSGFAFDIKDGIPDLVWPRQLTGPDKAALDLYDGRADVYDRYLPLTFSTFREDEVKVRNDMVDLLDLAAGQRVLEVGAGTGRDSEIIAGRLGATGELFCQDISQSMLRRNRERFVGGRQQAHFALANASNLPFPDKFFDAVFQFGGVGEFSDVPHFFREVARVTKVGGRVVVGDESMPPWLRRTTFAKVLTLTNAQFSAPLPLEHLPIEARQVRMRWIIGGTFYLIDFSIGEGEPAADFDFLIPGVRGGTHRSRYFGQLEGVKPETKQLALQAREKLGVSMHDWLEAVVRREAEKVLKGDDGNG